MSKVRIKLDARGCGTVEIDGVDIAEMCERVSIVAEPGGRPWVDLTIRADEIEVDLPDATVGDGTPA